MIRLLPLAALATVACTPLDKPEPAPAAPETAAPEGKCTTDGLERLIGKARSEAVAVEAKHLSNARALRWIAPGMAVTMDYREDRLNLHVDDRGVITEVKCG